MLATRPCCLVPQQQLGLLPQLALHNRFVQARMTGTLVTNLTEVNRIRKQRIERATEKRLPTRRPTVLCDPELGADALIMVGAFCRLRLRFLIRQDVPNTPRPRGLIGGPWLEGV